MTCFSMLKPLRFVRTPRDCLWYLRTYLPFRVSNTLSMAVRFSLSKNKGFGDMFLYVLGFEIRWRTSVLSLVPRYLLVCQINQLSILFSQKKPFRSMLISEDNDISFVRRFTVINKALSKGIWTVKQLCTLKQ